MALLNKRVSLLAKVEGTYGTDATPGAADGFWGVAGSAPSLVKQDNNLDNVARGGVLSKMQPAAPGPRHWKVSCQIPLRGAGAAYSTSVKPKISALMRACGFQETVTATPGVEKVEYKPRSTGFESISFYYYLDGLLYKLLGARGSVNFVLKAGGLCMAEFALEGLYADPTDASIVFPTGEPTTLPAPTFLSSAFQIGSENYAAAIESINVDMKNTLFAAPDSTKADGVGGIYLLDRNPDGSFNPEAALAATFNFYSKWKAQTLQDMSFQVGADQYNRVKFSVPEAALTDIQPQDRSGLAAFQIPFKAVSSSANGDDEVVVTFD